MGGSELADARVGCIPKFVIPENRRPANVEARGDGDARAVLCAAFIRRPATRTGIRTLCIGAHRRGLYAGKAKSRYKNYAKLRRNAT